LKPRTESRKSRCSTQILKTAPLVANKVDSSFMDFQVWDLPGHLDYFDPAFDTDNIFEEIGALIWVIDAQDEYLDAIQRLNMTILNLQQSYPMINIEVFVHKVDGLSDDFRGDTFRDIIQRVQDELSDNGYEQAPISFYQTSIYDHSIFEAFSKVIQKLIPQLPTLEALLNNLCGACNIEKAYLFDIMSKIYIATDTSPTDIATYEVCSDYIDVVIDVSEIYGWDRPEEAQDEAETGNNDAESLITMEKKGSRYLYLREINKYAHSMQAIEHVLTTLQIPRVGLHHGPGTSSREEGDHRLQRRCLPGRSQAGLPKERQRGTRGNTCDQRGLSA
jgi:Ras-related GTP-binding protein C/D